jgi:uncharacterized damage-inducible protein DinB
MTILDEQGRPEPPVAADELGTLLGFLDFQRATLEWKCSGLDSTGLATVIGTSTMTLGGLLLHAVLVENHWTTWWLLGHAEPPPGNAIDWTADPEWEWHAAAELAPDELRARWRDAVARSRAAVAAAVRTGGLDQLARRTWPDGRAPSLRWILVHLIEEYSRHNGHADLLREAVDGMTGE